jgi:hypothetical protein
MWRVFDRKYQKDVSTYEGTPITAIQVYDAILVSIGYSTKI